MTENTTTQSLWDVAKAVLRGKFIEIQSCLKKQELNRQHNFTPKATGKEDQRNPKLVERKKS